jgi:7-cyano-7-deazaguanine synthase
MKRALVLLSGGLDSSTCLAVALNEGYVVTTLAFDYGQRHRVELQKSTAIAQHYGIERQLVISLPFYRTLGGSALTDDTAVPKHVDTSEMQRSNSGDAKSQIPVTYVPGRNLIFLSIGVGTAEMIGADDIFIGVNALDYSGYPDCRPDFIKQFEKTAKLATRTGVVDGKIKIRTPLLDLSKAEIVKLAYKLKVPLSLTHSCYDPVGVEACGHCDSCLLRLRGFEEAGLIDPVAYVGVPNDPQL